jgi:DNA repair protein RecO (recombination protein O)
MGQYKTEAIILSARNWDESDRMVTLFSREYGKVTAIAYGARRPRNQMSGTVQPFVHAELALTAGKSLDSIKQCDIIESFRELREDLTKMSYASFLAELASELWPEREAEPKAFELLLDAFRLIGSRNPRLTALAGALQLLALGGFRPETSRCVVCDKPLTFPATFDGHTGGSIGSCCSQPGYSNFTADINQFMEKLLALNWQTPGHFSVTGAVLVETERLLAEFITCRLDKPLKSMTFISAVASPDNMSCRRAT